jgi:small subunit ribosomal protein S20
MFRREAYKLGGKWYSLWQVHATARLLLFFRKTPTMRGLLENGFDFPMANHKQAEKRARQAEKRREHNVGFRSSFRTAVKKVKKAIASGDKAAAQKVYQQSVSVIDSVADKKIVHKNKAARHKSRLTAAIKALA